jgi:hypothetical protein
MRMRISINIFLFLFILRVFSTEAQSYLAVKENNGTLSYYNIQNFQTIVFLSGNFVIKNSGVTINSFPISTLRNLSFVNNITTSLNDKNIYKTEKFILFPNPTNDLLNLTYKCKTENEISIIVSNFEGKTIIQRNMRAMMGENNISIPVSNLKIGTYLVQLEIGDKILISKFIKSR